MAIGRAAHEDDLLGRKGKLHPNHLRDERDLPGQLALVPRRDLPATEDTVPSIGLAHAGNHGHQRGFARAVGPHDRRQSGFADVERKALQNLGLAQPHSKIA
jgi:hypothetical protein